MGCRKSVCAFGEKRRMDDGEQGMEAETRPAERSPAGAKGVYRMAYGMNGEDWQWMRRCVSMKSHQHKAVDGGLWKGV